MEVMILHLFLNNKFTKSKHDIHIQIKLSIFVKVPNKDL